MSSSSNIAIVGTELHFEDSNGQRYFYEGNIVQSVDLTKNFGIADKYVYYKDEQGDTRRLPEEMVNSSYGERGYLKVSNSGSYLFYVDEGGERRIAHADAEGIAHSDSPKPF